MRQCDEQQTEETKPEGDSVSMLVFRPALPEIHLSLLKLGQLWIGVLPLIDELRIQRQRLAGVSVLRCSRRRSQR